MVLAAPRATKDGEYKIPLHMRDSVMATHRSHKPKTTGSTPVLAPNGVEMPHRLLT